MGGELAKERGSPNDGSDIVSGDGFVDGAAGAEGGGRRTFVIDSRLLHHNSAHFALVFSRVRVVSVKEEQEALCSKGF